ncbi:hypothetical protein EC950943_5035A, partial [Escherichia coli 95.0943]
MSCIKTNSIAWISLTHFIDWLTSLSNFILLFFRILSLIRIIFL